MVNIEGIINFFRKAQETTSTLLHITPLINVQSKTQADQRIDLPVDITIEGGKGNQSRYRWVTMSCPHKCGYKSKGMSLTSVDLAFHDALEDGMYKHLRQRHHDDILYFHVENDYLPQMRLFKSLLHT